MVWNVCGMENHQEITRIASDLFLLIGILWNNMEFGLRYRLNSGMTLNVKQMLLRKGKI